MWRAYTGVIHWVYLTRFRTYKIAFNTQTKPRREGGLRQINTCRQVPFLVKFSEKPTFRVWCLYRYLVHGICPLSWSIHHNFVVMVTLSPPLLLSPSKSFRHGNRNTLSLVMIYLALFNNVFKGTVHCSARWIRLKLGSCDRSSLKRESQKVFRQIYPSPILWEPFKVLEGLLVLKLTITAI